MTIFYPESSGEQKISGAIFSAKSRLITNPPHEDVEDNQQDALPQCCPEQLVYTENSQTLTNTASWTGLGTEVFPIIVSVNTLISEEPDNTLIILPDGLYAPPTASGGAGISSIVAQASDTNCINMSVTGDGTIGDPLTISAVPTLNSSTSNLLSCAAGGLMGTFSHSVSDSSTIDFNAGGGGSVGSPFALTGSVKLSAGSGNIIVASGDGIYARSYIGVADTPCVDMTISGLGTSISPYNISAVPIVDPTGTNLLGCTSEGLCSIWYGGVTDTSTIDFTNSGSGTQLNPFLVSGSVKVSSDVNNVIETHADGLYVSAQTIAVSGTDTNCANVTVTGVGTVGDPIAVAVDPIINSDSTNLLSCTSGGLLSRLFSASTDTSTIDFTTSGFGTSGSPFTVTGAVKVSASAGNVIAVLSDGLYVSSSSGGGGSGLDIVSAVGSDTSCIDMTVTGDGTGGDPLTISAVPIIDGSGTNLVSCGAGGFLAEFNYTVNDSASIDFTATGSGSSGDPFILTAINKLSATSGNIITASGDGLYARSYIQPSDTPCIDMSVTGLGTSGSPYLVSAVPIIDGSGGNLLSCGAGGLVAGFYGNVTDSTTINFSSSGNGKISSPFVITGSVNISGTAGNILTSDGGGLYVSDPTLDYTFSDTSTIDFTASGNGNAASPLSVSAAVKISSDAGNIISAHADGIYASGGGAGLSSISASGTDTNCIDMTVSGDGSVGDPLVISAAPVISSSLENLLSCTAGGLLADFEYSATDTNSLDVVLSGLGTNASPFNVSGDVKVSATSGNIISVLSDGLFAEIDFGSGNGCDLGYETFILTPSSISSGITLNITPNSAYSVLVQAENSPGVFHPVLDYTITGDLLEFSAAVQAVLASGEELVVRYPDGGICIGDGSGGTGIVSSVGLDTDCINMTVTGNGTGASPLTISAEPIIDPDSSNLISCGGSGLLGTFDYVVNDSATINFSSSGAGSAASPFTLTAVATISSTSGNRLTSDGAGLYVPAITASGTDTNCINMTVSGQGSVSSPLVVSAVPTLSVSSENLLSCTAGGLLADFSGTVTDTSSIDFTSSGSGTAASPFNVTGTVKVSATANNRLTTNADGLYVPGISASGSDTNCINMTVTGNGSVGNPLVVSAVPIISSSTNNLTSCGGGGILTVFNYTVNDSSTIDFTSSGFGTSLSPFTLTASAKISSTVNNRLTSDGTGLYVEQVVATGTDTNCIDMTVSGNGTTGSPLNISAAPIINTSSENLLSCTGGGLLADFAGSSTDTNSIDFTTSGSGTVGSPFNVTGSVKISATAGNVVTILSDGLYVSSGVGGGGSGLDAVSAVGTDTNCIDMTVTGNGTGASPLNISAVPIVDPDAGNLLTCGGSGLLADFSGSSTDTSTIDFTTSGAGTTGSPFNVTGAVKISAVAGNIITAQADGIYASGGGGGGLSSVSATAVDTNCIDMTVTGNGTGGSPLTIFAVPIINPSSSNLISCSASGLLSTLTANATDTNSIDFTVSGAGTAGSPLNVTGSVKVSATSGNRITTNADGLYVAAVSAQAADTNCIDMTVTGNGSSGSPITVSAVPIISSSAKNMLTCTAGGLLAQMSITNSAVACDPATAVTSLANSLEGVHYRVGDGSTSDPDHAYFSDGSTAVCIKKPQEELVMLTMGQAGTLAPDGVIADQPKLIIPAGNWVIEESWATLGIGGSTNTYVEFQKNSETEIVIVIPTGVEVKEATEIEGETLTGGDIIRSRVDTAGIGATDLVLQVYIRRVVC